MALNMLLEKLIEIERSIGRESNLALRRRVIDAQEYILAIQQGMAARGRMAPSTEGRSTDSFDAVSIERRGVKTLAERF